MGPMLAGGVRLLDTYLTGALEQLCDKKQLSLQACRWQNHSLNTCQHPPGFFLRFLMEQCHTLSSLRILSRCGAMRIP